MEGGENGEGLVKSTDTGIVGGTNGDGVVGENDTSLIGDNNGELRRLRLPLLWGCCSWRVLYVLRLVGVSLGKDTAKFRGRDLFATCSLDSLKHS